MVTGMAESAQAAFLVFATAGFLAAGFLDAGFFAGALTFFAAGTLFEEGPFAAFSAIRVTASSSVTVVAFMFAGSVALIFPCFT